ncbi:2Fe-2S iron-sulfur cluster-binding protein [Tepidiphilus sp. J10]|uniref:2Fe-2S iron-sulfur cluster-binding protein n=1 Tax=Tepidiphilus sp. J10 TaxID=2502185 RepID=UPI00115F3DE7
MTSNPAPEPEKESHEVLLVQTGEVYACSENESLLAGMCRLGRRGIPVGCLGGGCGVCKVKVVRGEVASLGPISRAHVSEEEERQGYTLACRAAPKGAVILEVVGKMQKSFFHGFAIQQNVSRTKQGGASWES